VRKLFSSCAFISVLGLSAASVRAQHLPPYHPPGAEGQHHRNEQRSTYGTGGGRFYGGPPRDGISYPGYWTYNRFSNLGFGGLNWYYGPLGGYTPYITTPYANTSFGYPNFGPYYSYVPLAPVVRQARPWQDPADAGLQGNGAQQNGAGNQAGGARQPPPPQPPQANAKIFPKPVSGDALRRSLRYQAQGDEWFAKQNYLQAYGHYKQAVSATPTRSEARFRMALALAATRNYSQAVDEIQRAMRINPKWPREGVPLDELFGADNILSKNAVLHKLASWVGEDIRDPDRLFLMGVLLHFNGDVDKSRVFMEAAFELAPNRAYAQAFLEADAGQRADLPAEEPRPAPPEEEGHDAAPAGPAIPGLPARPQPEEPKPRPLADARHSENTLDQGVPQAGGFQGVSD
jgi:tetratricopeptide (TPR) repeat protein